MNTKFTEGPWLKCSRGESLVGIKGKNVSVYNCGLSGSGKSPESVANAHLIAAAPDMYKVIEEIARLRDGEMHNAIDWIIDNTDDLINLLAKARGE